MCIRRKLIKETKMVNIRMFSSLLQLSTMTYEPSLGDCLGSDQPYYFHSKGLAVKGTWKFNVSQLF